MKWLTKKEKVLNHVKDIYVDDVSDKTKTKFEKDIESMLSENVAFGEYQKVEWDGKTMLPKKISLGGESILLAPLILLISIFLYFLTEEFWCLMIGLVLSLSCETVIYTKKTKKKKKGK